MLSKKFFVISVVFLLAFIAFGVWLGFYLSSSQSNPAAPSDYSAVVLSTGDIYFGKLSWFPWPHLNNVWLVQRSVDQNNQPQLGVVPFNRAFWAPVDELYLNPKNVISWTKLRNDSQVVKFIQNPSALQQQQQQAQPPGAPQPPSAPTSTKK